MKKEKVTTNKVTSKLEKVLWAVLILMFIVSLIGMFLGQYMDGNVFYKMCVIMTVLAAAILSAERFYFGTTTHNTLYSSSIKNGKNASPAAWISKITAHAMISQ